VDDVASVLDLSRASAVALVADLEADLAAIGESTAASPDDEHDPEGSTVGFERARVAALLAQARRSLAEIDEALERRRRGSYGVCGRCGTIIPPERLEAMPTASLCVACAATPRR
jgi:RNA polymerase-binding transcription factor DksA